ncbi:MAG: glycosyltransferase [Nanoarchaeota archaeon]|nr:glycosyltransferase [Nanoarchaeota archaeon]
MTEAEFAIAVRSTLDFMHVIFNSIFDVLLFITIVISVAYFFISLYVVFSKNKKSKEYDFDEKKAPFVTIQIPTYNELAAIQCAKNCANFDYPKDRYEIIIGDDSKDKEVSKKIYAFSKSEKLVKVTRRGNNDGYKAGNLNHMLKYSKGDILVLFDSDFTPKEDFLRRIVAPFIHDKNTPAVQARWSSINANQNIISLLGSTIIAVCHKIVLPFIQSRRKFSFLCGSAEAVRKDLLLKLGGWQTGSLTEDIEYSLRLLKNGHRIVYLDDLECDGEVPHKAKDLYRQQMRWAYGVVCAFKEHGRRITFNKKLTIEDKVYTYLDLSGYMISVLLMGLFMSGFISFITHAPEPINWAKFLSELGRNVLLTSGLVVTSIIAQVRNKNARKIPSIIGSFFSYGLVVVYYVNKGIFKAMLNKPMRWYMLNKNSNKSMY